MNNCLFFLSFFLSYLLTDSCKFERVSVNLFCSLFVFFRFDFKELQIVLYVTVAKLNSVLFWSTLYSLRGR